MLTTDTTLSFSNDKHAVSFNDNIRPTHLNNKPIFIVTRHFPEKPPLGLALSREPTEDHKRRRREWNSGGHIEHKFKYFGRTIMALKKHRLRKERFSWFAATKSPSPYSSLSLIQVTGGICFWSTTLLHTNGSSWLNPSISCTEENCTFISEEYGVEFSCSHRWISFPIIIRSRNHRRKLYISKTHQSLRWGRQSLFLWGRNEFTKHDLKRNARKVEGTCFIVKYSYLS